MITQNFTECDAFERRTAATKFFYYYLPSLSEPTLRTGNASPSGTRVLNHHAKLFSYTIPTSPLQKRTMPIQIYQADLRDPFDARGVLDILAIYHESLMGNNSPLPQEVRDTVIDGLLSCSNHVVFLAVQTDDSSNSIKAHPAAQVVGMAVCFENYSTFRAQRLINVHDLAVHPKYQGKKIGQSLLEKVVAHAKEQNQCAVTLEVRKDNANALKLYRKLGFSGIEQDAGNESMLFGKLVL